VQRCTDVALDNANIRFRIDNLESRRRLAVAADPVAVVVKEPFSEVDLPVVHFRMYSNYMAFLNRAEIRIFEQQPLQAEPLAIIPVDDTGLAEWQPGTKILAGPARELKYLLRAYDSKGNFDETDARPLWLYHQASPGNLMKSDKPSTQALLAAYGENDLARQQIPLGSGTVKVQGSTRFRLTRKATSLRRKFFPTAHKPSKSRSSTTPATARYTSAIWSSNAGTCSSSVLPI
jgi:hypothetical protein